MQELSIPVVILSKHRDDVEFFNKTMRDAGHAVRCQGVSRIEDLEKALASNPPQLLISFAGRHESRFEDVVKLKRRLARTTPLIVIGAKVDEATMIKVIQAGAQEVVSIMQPQRIRAVCERELRTFRLERALKDALQSAMQYKKQVKSLLSNAADAIAVVQEGIIVEANQIWADLFVESDSDAALGPLMDHFLPASHAALKGALMACGKGQWDDATLEIDGINRAGKTFAVALALEPSTHDDEPATRLSILRQQEPKAAPEQRREASLDTDPATGLLSRQGFLERLTHKLERRTQGGACALAFIRPDKFNAIEHAVGPVASEEIIAQIAAVLKRHTSESDVAGRFGGTVFTIALERGSLRDIESWAKQALTRIGEHLYEAADHSLSLTCTIGLAELSSDMDRAEEILRLAERANQRGRREGGNRVILEETSDASTLIKRVDALWVQRIRAALVEGRFRLKHLSIASLSGETLRMFDTFVRMIDEQGDDVTATEFVATARRNKMLRAIDRWVITTSLEFCASQASDLVFIKLSDESVLDTSLCGWLVEQAAKQGVKGQRLCFQVTEEDASRYQKQTRSLAESLRQNGFRFAIEQFGIGRDPQGILTGIPMDFVKFDGSLMQGIGDDLGAQEKLRNFVACANQRKIQTVAVHVENANTMAVLFQLGVAYMQGHYLHEPEVVLEAAL